MPQVSEMFHCVVTPTDQLVTYITDQERKVLSFAMVMTNAREEKISVLLPKEDALRLRAQLDTFIIQCAVERS